jgi:hypothetical protein
VKYLATADQLVAVAESPPQTTGTASSDRIQFAPVKGEAAYSRHGFPPLQRNGPYVFSLARPALPILAGQPRTSLKPLLTRPNKPTSEPGRNLPNPSSPRRPVNHPTKPLLPSLWFSSFPIRLAGVSADSRPLASPSENPGEFAGSPLLPLGLARAASFRPRRLIGGIRLTTRRR